MNMVWVAFPPPVRLSFDTVGDRHAEASHSVEDVAGDFCFGLLIGQSPGMKAPADDGLVSIHHGFDEASPAIPGATLPSNAAMLFYRSKMAIALRRPRLTQNGCRPRRNDHARRGAALQNLVINCVAVIGVGAAGGEKFDARAR
jgi:hypothetical protein